MEWAYYDFRGAWLFMSVSVCHLRGHQGNLSVRSEHQELVKQINEVDDPRIRDDMERELDSLVARMEVKGQQISKVRQHQQKVSSLCEGEGSCHLGGLSRNHVSSLKDERFLLKRKAINYSLPHSLLYLTHSLTHSLPLPLSAGWRHEAEMQDV